MRKRHHEEPVEAKPTEESASEVAAEFSPVVAPAEEEAHAVVAEVVMPSPIETPTPEALRVVEIKGAGGHRVGSKITLPDGIWRVVKVLAPNKVAVVPA